MQRLKFLILAFVLFSYGNTAIAQQPPVFAPGGKAILGYDPVAYFTKSAPAKGSEEFKYRYLNTDWYFSSKQNMEMFKADPTKYAPQYGGYCAFGMAGGYKAEIIPEAWSIEDGKLYLNYNLKIQKEWSVDKANMIKKGDANWPKVKLQ